MCDQERKGSEDRAVEQNDGFGAGVWGMAEVVDVAVRTQATKDRGTGWRINREALGADGDFAVIADAEVEALTPDKGPPRAVGDGTQDRAVFGAGLVTCGGWSGAEFTVDLVLVDVGQELVEQTVGAFEFQDAVGRQEGRQAFLPVNEAPHPFSQVTLSISARGMVRH